MSLIVDRIKDAEDKGIAKIMFSRAEWDRDISQWMMAGTLQHLKDTWLSRSTFGADAEVFYIPGTQEIMVYRHDIARRLLATDEEPT